MTDTVETKKLMSFVDRLERLDESETAIKEDKKEILADAKGQGFEPKFLKRIVAWRKQDAEKRKMEEAEWEVYRLAANLD